LVKGVKSWNIHRNPLFYQEIWGFPAKQKLHPILDTHWRKLKNYEHYEIYETCHDDGENNDDFIMFS
jgi:hypothetical protein